jgi:hypothetical protein
VERRGATTGSVIRGIGGAGRKEEEAGRGHAPEHHVVFEGPAPILQLELRRLFVQLRTTPGGIIALWHCDIVVLWQMCGIAKYQCVTVSTLCHFVVAAPAPAS